MSKRRGLQDLFEVGRMLGSPNEPLDSPTPPTSAVVRARSRLESEVTVERTRGFDDELFEQSTDGAHDFEHPPPHDPTEVAATRVPGGLDGASSSAVPSLEPPEKAPVHRGVPWLAWVLVSTAASTLLVIASLASRSDEQIPPQSLNPPPAVESKPAPLVSVSTPSEPAEAPTIEVEPHVLAAPPKPSTPPRPPRRSASPSPGLPTDHDARAEALEAETVEFAQVESRRRKLLRRHSIREQDLEMLGVSARVLEVWDQARRDLDPKRGEQSLRELERGLGQATIDRKFLEQRLARVLRKATAWARAHSEDERSRVWESDYFNLRRRLLEPGVDPGSSRALELNAEIDGLERAIDKASAR